MNSTTSLKLTTLGEARADMRELVIAWANDAESLLPTYILELGTERSGAKSGCVCPGCSNPLIAVNNAKESYLRRPHFRHHPGTGAQDCSIVAARVAVLRTMQDLGWIDLPARNLTGSVVGLDGQIFEGQSGRTAERLYIRNAEFRDFAPAILHLDDGRQVSVLLRGSNAPTEAGSDLGAAIFIEVDDPTVALMDPQQLRERLSLKGSACWHRHWDDAQILDDATAQARETAIEHLAIAPPDLVLPSDMPAELKTETVLHYAVKHILQEAGQLRTPKDKIYVEAFSQKQKYSRAWELPEQQLILKNLEMEKRLGLTRPDLVCEAMDDSGGLSYPALCIEVTVSNPIGMERRERIRSVGLPTLEINLSPLKGLLTKTRLTHLVVNDTSLKTWVFHPLVSEKLLELKAEIYRLRDAEDLAIEEEEAERSRVIATPLAQLSTRYLDKAYAYFLLLQRMEDRSSQPPSHAAIAVADARQELSDAAQLLMIKGYPGADDADFLDARGILETLLSLKFDRGLCRNLNTGFQVLNALMTGGRGIENELTPLHLAAARAFDVPMTTTQRALVDEWGRAVKERIRTVRNCYVRSQTHDALLAILFPELLDALTRTTYRHFSSIYQKQNEPTRARPKDALDMDGTPEISASSPEWLQNPAHKFFVLQGPQFDAWVREHPDQAQTLGIRFKVRKT